MRRLWAGLTLLLVLGGILAPATAQTRFAWSDSAITFGRYTLEDCLAATRRLAQSASRREQLVSGLWADTLPPDGPRGGGSRPVLRPLPDTVVATARRCAARFTEPSPSLELNDFPLLLELYLTANRDADAATLVARRLAAVPATDTAYEAVEDTVLQAYGLTNVVRFMSRPRSMILDGFNGPKPAQPLRRAAIEQILEARLHRGSGRTGAPIPVQLMNLAMLVGDTAAARARATQIIAEWEQHPAAERADGRWGSPGVHAALVMLHHRELLDSLRRSTASYAALQRALDVRVFGQEQADRRWAAAPGLVGTPAPAVVGDFWFRRGAGDTARPRRGQVGLVVGLNASAQTRCRPAARGTQEEVPAAEASRSSRSCWPLFAMLRRLAQRFAALEITLVTATWGNVSYRAYPEPAQEAEVLRQWLHDVHQMPGTLVVRTTRTMRIPAPDRRLVREEGDRIDTFLVDRDGLLVQMGWGGNDYESVVQYQWWSQYAAVEAWYAELIEATLQQQAQVPSQRTGPAVAAPRP